MISGIIIIGLIGVIDLMLFIACMELEHEERNRNNRSARHHRHNSDMGRHPQILTEQRGQDRERGFVNGADGETSLHARRLHL